MTITLKSIIALSALAVFLGLAAASPATLAFADQTDRWTYDIDKEDAELGDYFGWNSGADEKDAQSGDNFGWTLGSGRPAGNGQGDGQTPANSAPPILPVNSSQPEDPSKPNDRQGSTRRAR